MSGLPWIKWYPADFLNGIVELKPLEIAVYTVVLNLIYDSGGPIPNDEARLARRLQMRPTSVRAALEGLISSGKLTVEGGMLTNRRAQKTLSSRGGVAADATPAAEAATVGKWGDAPGERGRHLRSQRLSEARRKGVHTAFEWATLLAFCGENCLRCHASSDLVKDHITPIYQGGSDGVENLQPLCRKCNASKGPETVDFRPDGWRQAVSGAQKMPPKMPAEGLPQKLEARSQKPENESVASGAGLFEAPPDPAIAALGESPVQECFRLYNELVDRLPKGAAAKAEDLTRARQSAIKARIAGAGSDKWKAALDAVEHSRFLCGEVEGSRGRFRLTLEYVTRPTGFQKLVEGGWDRDREPPKKEMDLDAWPIERWERVMIRFNHSGAWPDNAGPKPGEPGCLAPANLQKARR